MANDQDKLEGLPSVDNLAGLELYGEGFEPEAWVEHTPDRTTTVAIYYQMAIDYGGISPTAARKALDLFGDQAEEARAHPGRHPDIDRLFEVIDRGQYLSVRAVPRQ